MTAARQLPTVVPLRPVVTSTYVVPRVRLQRRLRRIGRSQFAADLRRGGRRALAWLGLFGVVYGFIVVLRGAAYAAELAGLVR